ncbi:MAG: MlaD family protein, partial [Thermodesulfobacteriota bacterium]
TINTEGLLGAKYIEIKRGENFNDKLKNGGFLVGEPPFEIQEIVDQSKELLTNIVKISDNMNSIIETFSDETNLVKFEEMLSSVKESSESFKEILKGIETEKGTLNALIYDVDFKNNIKSSIKSFNELSSLLSEAGEKINEEKSFDDITETLKNIREITDALNGGEGTLGALLIDPSIHDSLKGVLGEAERSKFVRASVKYMLEEKKEENKEK